MAHRVACRAVSDFHCSTVRWNGAARPTTFIDARRLTAAISAEDVGTVGENLVTVYDPGAAPPETAPLSLRVVEVLYFTYLPVLLR